jgi:hypothetical protein
VPVTFTVLEPVVAELVALSVRVLLLVVGFGLNDAVTPLGNAEVTARLTLPEKLFAAFTVIVLTALLVWARLTELGEADKVKVPSAVTLRLIATVWVKLPEVPVTVTIEEPIVAESVAVRVKVLVPVAGLGLNDAVTPLGNPDVTAKFTLPAKLLLGFTAIVLVLSPP